MRARALIAGSLVLGSLAVGAPVATAAPPTDADDGERHCMVKVTGQAPDGELRLSEPVCYRSRGAVALRTSVSLLATLGIHYEDPGFGGQSISVIGSTCGGGYTNLTAVWRNRVSSTINGCPEVRFYNLVDLGGDSESTTSNRDLSTLDNRADSIQYLP